VIYDLRNFLEVQKLKQYRFSNKRRNISCGNEIAMRWN